jgi:hypothetical protein
VGNCYFSYSSRTCRYEMYLPLQQNRVHGSCHGQQKGHGARANREGRERAGIIVTNVLMNYDPCSCAVMASTSNENEGPSFQLCHCICNLFYPWRSAAVRSTSCSGLGPHAIKLTAPPSDARRRAARDTARPPWLITCRRRRPPPDHTLRARASVPLTFAHL